jgi:hypothetical protein
MPFAKKCNLIIWSLAKILRNSFSKKCNRSRWLRSLPQKPGVSARTGQVETIVIEQSVFSQPLLFLLEAGDDGEVFERSGVAFHFAAGRDFLEDAAHDFSAAGLGQSGRKADIVRLGQ